MDPTRPEWLQLIREAPLDPDLPICDPHHHLWTHRGRYLLEDFPRDSGSGPNIVATVFVTCDAMFRTSGPPELRPIGETEFVEAIAMQSATGDHGPTAVASGIVGHADLTLGAAVVRVLQAHLEASPTRFRGIRHSVTWDASPEIWNAAPNPRPRLMEDTAFRAGFACLEKYGLSFEAWMFHPQLPELVSLARAHPNVQIVLNHTGGPLGVGPYAGKRDEAFGVWQRGIKQVAACSNVAIKLGGLGMPRAGFGWDTRSAPPDSFELAEAMRPYYLACIYHFGPGRCMFESNFPPDKVSYSYCVMWNAFKRITQAFTVAERNALFHDTAMKTYRLEPRARPPLTPAPRNN